MTAEGTCFPLFRGAVGGRLLRLVTHHQVKEEVVLHVVEAFREALAVQLAAPAEGAEGVAAEGVEAPAQAEGEGEGSTGEEGEAAAEAPQAA